jgi:Cysteine protease
VQIVGYDSTAGIPHYIIRNSWGTSFGDNGYVYLAIGSNVCGKYFYVELYTRECYYYYFFFFRGKCGGDLPSWRQI